MDDRSTAPPPGYSESELVYELPPGYTSGTTYTIGSHKLREPLVHMSHVKAHLCLLRAIHDLKAIVMSGEDLRIPQEALVMEPWQRWTWFVGLAVERFERWIASIHPGPLREWIEDELPPVDVLMIWQAYMLNPIWYAEDCDRIPTLKVLKILGGRLLSSLVEIGDINEYVSSDEHRDRWLEQTSTVFDPIDAAMLLRTHNVECPECSTHIDAPFITSDDAGYSQHQFAVQCTNCSFVITREVLAVVKFTHDFVLDPENREDVDLYGDGVFMAGTVRSSVAGIVRSRAQATKLSLLDAYPLNKPSPSASKWEWRKNIYKVTGYSLKTVLAAILSKVLAKGYNVQKVISAYADDRPFSVNLVGAAVRHSIFIDEIQKTHWLNPDHFGDNAEDDLVLSQAISRYHAFLDLIASSSGPRILYVPTLDVDLVWHTHQMMGSRYHAQCANYLQTVVDHYDRVEASVLASCFDATCRAWRERFGLPYSYCGCPLPGDKISERLSRFKQRLTKPLHPTGDIVPLNREDAILATHASEHNSFPMPGTESSREKHLVKINKRKERKEKKDPHARSHDPAFVHRLPIYTGPHARGIVPGDRTLAYSWVLGGGGGNDGYTWSTISQGDPRASIMLAATSTAGMSS